MLLVSHNMNAIETLCPQSIWLESGVLVGYAKTGEIKSAYLQQRRLVSRSEESRSIQIEDGLTIQNISVHPRSVRCGDPAEIRIKFHAETSGQIRECAVLLQSASGVRIAIVDARASGTIPFRFSHGRFEIVVRIASLSLVEGEIALGLYVVTDHFAGNFLEIYEFDIVGPRTSKIAPYPPEARGILALSADVSIELRDPVPAS